MDFSLSINEVEYSYGDEVEKLCAVSTLQDARRSLYLRRNNPCIECYPSRDSHA